MGEIQRSQSINMSSNGPSPGNKRSSSYPNDLSVGGDSLSGITNSLRDSPKAYMMTLMVEELQQPCKNELSAPNVFNAGAVKKGGLKFRKMYLAALAALLSAVAMGMATGYSAPATYDMQKRPNRRITVSADEVTWIGSLVALGATMGGVFAGTLADKLGRKEVLIYNSVPFLFGWLLIIYAPTVSMVFVGRSFCGVACGVISVTVPMYAVEISTPGVRGLLGASYQGFLVVGSLISMTLGAYIPWTWLAVASGAMVVAGLICLCPMPESPRWLVAHGKWEESIKAVQFLQGDHLDAKSECTAIMEDLKTQPAGKLTLRDFLSPTVYKPALLSAALMLFQQFSGANSVLYYTSDVFENSGSTLEPTVSSIIVAAVQVVATLVSTMLVDKAGRRMLLLLSGSVMALSMAILGTFSFLDHKDGTIRETMGWIPLVSLLVFISAFSFGYGPLPWLMVAEMVPVRARSIISGMATIFNGIFAFTVTKTYKMLEEELNPYGMYWAYSGISVLGCFFMWYFLPETKGKRLEEIQKIFIGVQQNTEERTISSITLREQI